MLPDDLDEDLCLLYGKFPIDTLAASEIEIDEEKIEGKQL